MIGTSAPPTNLDNDDEMREPEDSEDDDMRYSPASPGTPMSVQQLAHCTETTTTGPLDQDRGESGESPCGDAVAESDRQQSRSQQRQQSRSQPDSRAGVSQTAEPESDRQQSRSQRSAESAGIPDERSVVLPKEWQPRSARDAEVEDGMELMLNVVEQEELLHNELSECTAETVKIIAALGGQTGGYRRDRRRAV